MGSDSPAAPDSATANPSKRKAPRNGAKRNKRRASNSARQGRTGSNKQAGPSFTLGRSKARAGSRSSARLKGARGTDRVRQAATQATTLAAHRNFISSGEVTASAQYYVTSVQHGRMHALDVRSAQEIFRALPVETCSGADVLHGTGLVLSQSVDADDVIFRQKMPMLRDEAALERYESGMDFYALYGAVIWMEGDPATGGGGIPLVEVVKVNRNEARLQPTALYYVNRGAPEKDKTGGESTSKRRKVAGTANTKLVTTTRKCSSTGEFEVTLDLVATTRIGAGEEVLWTYSSGANAKELRGFRSEEALVNRATNGAGCGYHALARVPGGGLSIR